MPHTIPIYHVDAFAHAPFSGNPAAVCLLEKAMDDSWMQRVAAEMNLSETAFVQASDNGFLLRWFTPTTEVELCGHATLATAHVLWEQGLLAPSENALFHTQSGMLVAQNTTKTIQLDFPASPVYVTAAPDGLFSALNIATDQVFTNGTDYLIPLKDVSVLRKLEPDFTALAKIKTRCIMVTAVSEVSAYDVISRVFAPAVGINEDPVTGAAHCSLAPFWAARLNTNTLRAYQASARGGELTLELDNKRVYLSGSAITIARGKLYV